jgi:TRAP-type C4-dicarboxylate transport system substrate-binding protein
MRDQNIATIVPLRVVAWLLVIGAWGTLASSAVDAQDAAMRRAWKLSVAVGPAFALGKAAETWAKLVADGSAGTLPIDIHPGATLAQRDPDREFAALRDGAADLAVGSTLHWSAQVSELAVVGLPWLAPEPNELAALTTGVMKARLFAAIERAGAVPLALAPLGHRALVARSKSIRTPDDIRGLKVRITSARFLVDFYAGLGALPFAMTFAEAANQFRSGALDAQEGPVATFAATRLDSLGLRDVTLWDGVAEIAIFAVNRAVWEGWSANQRAQVGSAAEAAAKELTRLADAERDSALATLKSRDMSVLRLTASGRAAFAAAARPTYDKWAAIAGEELVRAAESAVKSAASPP